MYEKRIDSLNGLITEIREMAKHEARESRDENRSRWWFRGQRSETWDLLPSVYRDYRPREERILAQNFRARAGLRHTHRLRYREYADWLALMQHYRLPTRLLDWSHSPLVAAFFAVEMAMPHFSPPPRKLPAACIWALSPTRLNVEQKLKPYWYPLNAFRLRPLVLAAFIEEEADAAKGAETPDVAAAMVVETDIRMLVQQGAFTIHGSRVALNKMPGRNAWLRKLVIPAGAVRRVAYELRLLGVDLAGLFPDLGSLAQDLASSARKRT